MDGFSCAKGSKVFSVLFAVFIRSGFAPSFSERDKEITTNLPI